MRILVGTLYTVENEFEECVASIRRQTYQDFEHLVIRGLPKAKAHSRLYGAFVERAGDFELLIKVDADMVLTSNNLFADIVSAFERDRDLALLGIYVWDFFSDQLIEGLNTYRNTLRFLQPDSLFTDKAIDRTGVKLRRDRADLAPAAIHCKNPSPLQAFHYGIHKALKAMQFGRPASIRQTRSLRGHWSILEGTWQHFLKCADTRLALAVLGGELGLQRRFTVEHLDYSNPYVSQVLEDYSGLSVEELREEILDLREANWGFLPSKVRANVLWLLNTQQPFSPVTMWYLARGMAEAIVRRASNVIAGIVLKAGQCLRRASS